MSGIQVSLRELIEAILEQRKLYRYTVSMVFIVITMTIIIVWNWIIFSNALNRKHELEYELKRIKTISEMVKSHPEYLDYLRAKHGKLQPSPEAGKTAPEQIRKDGQTDPN